LPDYDVKSNFYELGYSFKDRDTILTLYHLNKNLQIVDEVKYTKVANKATDETNAGWGIQFITNKILVAGKYLAIDTAGKTLPVEFSNGGKVIGFLGFKSFDINTDFMVEDDNNIDDVVFDLYSKASKRFIYNFKSDTLLLYDESHNADSTKLIRGKLQYKLVRQK
jgi:hypothetical protein